MLLAVLFFTRGTVHLQGTFACPSTPCLLAVPLCLNKDYLVRGQPAEAPCILASACEVSPSLVFDFRAMSVILYKGAGSGPIRLYVRERNHFLEVILRGPSQRVQEALN